MTNAETDPELDASSYRTRGGVGVHREVEAFDDVEAISALIRDLDTKRGVALASSFEYPGRYTRWDFGFTDPPLVLVSRDRSFFLRALNERGAILLPALETALARGAGVTSMRREGQELRGEIESAERRFPEEERSKQPSVFSVIRAMIELFASDADPHLGLYGAFGYDLAFQFESVDYKLDRPADQRDVVLYLPDEVLVIDHRRERALRRRYEFEVGEHSTRGIPRSGSAVPYAIPQPGERTCDHAPGEYAANVEKAREAFKRGDLFEVVVGQTFSQPSTDPPSTLFERLRAANPAPYMFLMNLGDQEYLVGASPEMYVRVEGSRVETCPISGTIARGKDPLGDAVAIQKLLNSVKDESELTMCTDVDRNDKSRVCEPGSVKVIGRRQIEMYSRLIHTVDHVEGQLRPGFDALDAFLVHTWAVTVTGAPKLWAMQFVEDHEKTCRAWYGGAVGFVGFNGNMNTGLTLRTIRLKDGVAQVRAGATLLYDSDPEEEERETRVKASAFLDAITGAAAPEAKTAIARARPGEGRRILLVDHEDSFVHTLANYFRQTGAVVVTLRAGFPHAEIDALAPDMVVLSPGPGCPRDFDVSGSAAAALERSLPLFGVCLGLQGIVEHFGGELGLLDYPMHGKPSEICTHPAKLFEGLPERFRAARYHSLFAIREKLPPELRVTASSDDGVVMAIEHTQLPIAAVQFHPESILTTEDECGLRLIHNAVKSLISD